MCWAKWLLPKQFAHRNIVCIFYVQYLSHIWPFVTLCSSDGIYMPSSFLSQLFCFFGICACCVFQMLPVLRYQTYVVGSTRQSLDIFMLSWSMQAAVVWNDESTSMLMELYRSSWVRLTVSVWLMLMLVNNFVHSINILLNFSSKHSSSSHVGLGWWRLKTKIWYGIIGSFQQVFRLSHEWVWFCCFYPWVILNL